MDYNRMKATADRLLDSAAQGEIEYQGDVTTTPGATPLSSPTVTRQFELTSGVARGVSFKFVDGETILATDLQVIVKAAADIAVGEMLRIDGVSRVVIRLDNIPAAGIVCAKRVFVR